jgi:hypothetical protein
MSVRAGLRAVLDWPLRRWAIAAALLAAGAGLALLAQQREQARAHYAATVATTQQVRREAAQYRAEIAARPAQSALAPAQDSAAVPGPQESLRDILLWAAKASGVASGMRLDAGAQQSMTVYFAPKGQEAGAPLGAVLGCLWRAEQASGGALTALEIDTSGRAVHVTATLSRAAPGGATMHREDAQ